MKLVLGLFGLLLLIIIVGTYSKSLLFPSFNFLGTSTATTTIDNQKFTVTVAKTQADQEKGLSGKSSLDQDSGMLFVFDNAGKYYFWMKGMQFPIDIIYIKNNKIVDIFSNVQPPAKGIPDANIPRYVSSDTADHVLEINAGISNKDNFKKGDSVSYSGV